MDNPTAWLALLLAAPLLLQGVSLIRYGGEERPLGVLNLFIVALGLLSFVLMANGMMVFGRELGVVMVQGFWGRGGLYVLLIGVPVAAGLLVHVMRAKMKAPIPLRLVVFAGAVAGLIACFFLHRLNPSDPMPFRVCEYDLWWPALPWWIAACLLGSIAPIVGLHRRREWLIVDLALSSAVAMLATADGSFHPVYAEETTRTIWLLCLFIAFPALVAVSAWSIRIRRGEATIFDPPFWHRTLVTFVLTLAAFLSCYAWMYKATLFAMAMWFVPAVAAVIAILRRGVPAFKKWRDDQFPVPDIGRPGRADDIGLVVALVGLASGAADYLYFGLLPTSWSLTIVVVSWLAIVEVLSVSTIDSAAAVSHLGEASKNAVKTIGRRATALGDAVGKFFSASSWHVAAMKTLFAVLGGVIILVACAELPRRGKTTIMPFSVTLSSKEAAPTKEQSEKLEATGKKLAQLIPDRILNALGLLRSELRTDVITLSTRGGKSETSFVSVRETPAGWDTVLAKSSDLKLGGVEVPISVLAAPVQDIMRSLLGERVITGAFVEQAGFTMHASSSTGDYWRASQPPGDHVDAPPPPSAPPAPAKKTAKKSAQKPAQPAGDTQAAGASSSLESATALAEQIAFQMISGDPAMVSAGMTNDWEALVEFRHGLADWRRYDAGDPDRLANAIGHFQKAISIDSKFALAYYRLGLAYKDDQQPSLAMNQLRKSIDIRPDFVPGFDALASLLFDADSKHAEAKELWRRVLLLPSVLRSPEDDSSAYYGLCRTAVDDRQNNLAYFFCKRAELALNDLPSNVQEQSRIRQARALIMTYTGIAVEWKGTVDSRDTTTDWQCYPAGIKSVELNAGRWVTKHTNQSSLYNRAALRYYERAISLLPDDMVLRCNAASTLAALGDRSLINELSRNARARVAAANQLANETETKGFPDAANYYRFILQEYDSAVAMSPSNLEALNMYAYTFWSWRRRVPAEKPPDGPEPEIALKAERYARQAVRMARDNVTKADETAYLSTLGEVLLGQGRVEEARDVLAQTIAKLPQRAAFDEIRWDLAQADLCARSTNEILKLGLDGQTLLKDAVTQLKVIRGHAQGRENSEYSGLPESLDGEYALPVCVWSEASVLQRAPDPQQPRYEATVSYKSQPPCDWIVVAAAVKDPEVVDGQSKEYCLHVWGDGIDETSDSMKVFLTNEPKRTHFVYFAQLEESDGPARSAVQRIETFGETANCKHNQIVVAFSQAKQPKKR